MMERGMRGRERLSIVIFPDVRSSKRKRVRIKEDLPL